MSNGYIYVLTNPSMPGLAKVGKTMRKPDTRVLEISSATGVPSPFVLAFQQPVVDCDSAEVWVHRELDRGGHRHADNREFFSAPLHVIVRIVAQAGAIQSIAGEDETPNAAGLGNSAVNLSEELTELGFAYLDGTDTVLRSHSQALKHFEQAAAMDHGGACRMAGLLYQWGNDGRGKNPERALQLLKKSVALGNWQDHASIAGLFLEHGQQSAAQRCWKQFFMCASDELNKSSEYDAEYCRAAIQSDGVRYCEIIAAGELKHCVDELVIARLSKQLLEGVEVMLSRNEPEPDKWYREFKEARLLSARKFIEQQMASVSY